MIFFKVIHDYGTLNLQTSLLSKINVKDSAFKIEGRRIIMNRNIILIIWLCIFAIASISIRWGAQTLIIGLDLYSSFDPTQWLVLALFAILPLYFLIFSICEKQPLWRKILYLLGLWFGSFVIFPLEFLNKYGANPLTRTHIIALAFLDILLLTILTWAIMFGNWTYYIQSYQTDFTFFFITWNLIAMVIGLIYKVFSNSKIYFKTLMEIE